MLDGSFIYYKVSDIRKAINKRSHVPEHDVMLELLDEIEQRTYKVDYCEFINRSAVRASDRFLSWETARSEIKSVISKLKEFEE